MSRTNLNNLIPPRIRVAKHAINAWYLGEPELHLLSRLCKSDRLAIDVGANTGVYTWYLRKFARGVVAFEPQRAMADFLKADFGSSVRVEGVGLSDVSGLSNANSE